MPQYTAEGSEKFNFTLTEFPSQLGLLRRSTTPLDGSLRLWVRAGDGGGGRFSELGSTLCANKFPSQRGLSKLLLVVQSLDNKKTRRAGTPG